MATSDNVVRVGLTPKLKDVDTLVSMLTYAHGPAKYLEPTIVGSKSKLFQPPIPEFRLLNTCLDVPGECVSFDPVDGPAIVLVYGGRGSFSVTSDVSKGITPAGEERVVVEAGDVFFLPASCGFEAISDGDAGLAFCKAFFQAA